MIELLQYPFMQRALLGGVLVGALASYFGVFVVQRQMSFLGAGLAHAAFGGIALGLLLQTEPLWVAMPFTVVVSVGINWLRGHTRLAGDTAVGVLFAVAVALGLVFLSFREGAMVDAFAYLFGSILTVTKTDLMATGALVVVAAATAPRLWGRWAYASFDADTASADRLPVERDDYLLFVLLAVTVVVAVKVVGIVLMAAFLVIPAATARLRASTFFGSTLISLTIGVLSALAGLMLSAAADLPSGATIVLVQATLFAGVAISARNGTR
jgi:zinc transport system permease protein